jgi:hypothetical protein
MSMASSERTSVGRSHSVTGLASKKSYDVRFLISIAIVAVGVIVAICALAAHPGVSPEGLMMAVPP